METGVDRAAPLACGSFQSPVGLLRLFASEVGIRAVLWETEAEGRVRLPAHVQLPEHPVIAQARQELAEYFRREREYFTVALDLQGTPFQQAVWSYLTTIPFGETRSYVQAARELGKPGASRAVGAANGRNPASIIVPCHRVIGASGRLTGFAGGLDAKAYLLQMERPPGLLPLESVL